MRVIQSLLLMSFLIICQNIFSADSLKQASQKMKIGKYGDLLKRVQQGDTTVDFLEFRLAFVKSGSYKPYRDDLKELYKQMYEDINNGMNSRAIETAQKILKKQYVDINTHMVCVKAYGELGDTVKQQFHKFIVEGLISSILTSGDGKSKETAFLVISVDEEYSVLRNYFGYQIQRQSLDTEQEGDYDIFDVIDPKTNEKMTFYFNITLPFKWLNKKFG